MKYGSAGFSAYGYHAGCAFANGTYEEALADPNAAQFLCTEEQAAAFTSIDEGYLAKCMYDRSGVGKCGIPNPEGTRYADPFSNIEPVRFDTAWQVKCHL